MRERMYEIYDEEKFIGKLSADEAAKIIGTTIKMRLRCGIWRLIN